MRRKATFVLSSASGLCLGVVFVFAFTLQLIRHKAAVGSNLQPQLFPERFAFLEALEELFKDADNNRVDADAFGFGPILELEPGFCAYVEELRV